MHWKKMMQQIKASSGQLTSTRSYSILIEELKKFTNLNEPWKWFDEFIEQKVLVVCRISRELQ